MKLPGRSSCQLLWVWGPGGDLGGGRGTSEPHVSRHRGCPGWRSGRDAVDLRPPDISVSPPRGRRGAPGGGPAPTAPPCSCEAPEAACQQGQEQDNGEAWAGDPPRPGRRAGGAFLCAPPVLASWCHWPLGRAHSRPTRCPGAALRGIRPALPRLGLAGAPPGLRAVDPQMAPPTPVDLSTETAENQGV